MIVFDSSALTKLLLDEVEKDVARELWLGCDAPLAAALAYPEVCTALGAAERDHRITADGLHQALTLWDTLWTDLRVIAFTIEVAESAGRLAVAQGLRGADAVHLASLLALDSPQASLASWDDRQREGARATGIALVPAP